MTTLDETSPFAMAQEQVKLSLGELYSTYFNDLFVLKTNVTIGGQTAEIDFSTNDLVLKCRYPPLGFSLNEASAELGALLRKYGVCQVNSVWCEEAPFIQVRALPSTAPAKQLIIMSCLQVTFPSAHGLETFLNAKDRVEVDLASLFSRHLSQSAAEPCTLSCEVEMELFLVAPDDKQKDARVISVSSDNCSECLSILKDSSVFEFGSMFRAYHHTPDRAFSKGIKTE